MKTNGEKPAAVPTGAMMMMKAMGLDPAAIMQNVEGAKTAALQTMHHFNARLDGIEKKLDEILACVQKVN
jgi:hypothetical protein